jgi:hypothetical protein
MTWAGDDRVLGPSQPRIALREVSLRLRCRHRLAGGDERARHDPQGRGRREGGEDGDRRHESDAEHAAAGDALLHEAEAATRAVRLGRRHREVAVGTAHAPIHTRSLAPAPPARCAIIGRAMLFPRHVLLAIREGRVDLAFRRWERPRVLQGSRLRTAVGVLEVGRVETVDRTAIGDEEARRAGCPSRDELLAMLDRRERGDIHRIELRYAGPDPRVELRSRVDLSADELADLRRRLDRLDRSSRHGPWTRGVLELIAERPEVRAEELAGSMGREKLPFKRDVRKLKELGLTESLSPGYRLSPRGRAVLDALDR